MNLVEVLVTEADLMVMTGCVSEAISTDAPRISGKKVRKGWILKGVCQKWREKSSG